MSIVTSRDIGLPIEILMKLKENPEISGVELSDTLKKLIV
jgi:hypothetical protein